jgi:hypothetical protein
MSSIQLSEDLLLDIQKTLISHDPNAQEMGVAVQYLAAISGLLVANFKSHDQEQKKHLLQQLYGFAEHVMTDNTEKEKAAAAANDEAFGIWKP